MLKRARLQVAAADNARPGVLKRHRGVQHFVLPLRISGYFSDRPVDSDKMATKTLWGAVTVRIDATEPDVECRLTQPKGVFDGYNRNEL